MRVNQGKVYGDGRERGHSRENSPEVRKRKPSLGNLDLLNIAGAWAGREFGKGGVGGRQTKAEESTGIKGRPGGRAGWHLRCQSLASAKPSCKHWIG